MVLDTLKIAILKISQTSEIKLTIEDFGNVGVRLSHGDTRPLVYTIGLRNGVILERFQSEDIVFREMRRELSVNKKMTSKLCFYL